MGHIERETEQERGRDFYLCILKLSIHLYSLFLSDI